MAFICQGLSCSFSMVFTFQFSSLDVWTLYYFETYIYMPQNRIYIVSMDFSLLHCESEHWCTRWEFQNNHIEKETVLITTCRHGIGNLPHSHIHTHAHSHTPHSYFFRAPKWCILVDLRCFLLGLDHLWETQVQKGNFSKK